jgi:hypothetical protein
MSMIIDGTNGLTFNNATTQASAGQVLQVSSATNSTYTQIASTSFTDTGLTISITPKFSTSKILVIVNQQMSVYRETNASITGCLQIVRGSTSIYLSEKYNEIASGTNTGGVIANSNQGCLIYLDSPATTSSTTYKTQGRASTTSNNGFILMNNYLSGSTTSSITVMEIAA